LKLVRVPLAWLQGLLSRAWSGHLASGRLNGTVALDVDDEGVRTSANVALIGAGFDSKDGRIAGQKLDAAGYVTLDTRGGHDDIRADLKLQKGQLLLGSFYARFPDHDVHLSLDARFEKQQVAVRELRFTDPGTLQLTG